MAKDIFGDDITKKQDDFGAMLDASMTGAGGKVSKGDKVSAEILTIGKEEIFVNVNGQDGVLSKLELVDENGLVKVQIGDKVDLFVTKIQEGLIHLTSKPSSKALAEGLEDAFDFETPVEGRVSEAVNGGFRVVMMGKTAFCPMSQMDKGQITEPEKYIGKKFDFIITKYEGKGRNIVVSRRKVMDMEAAENQGAFMQSAKPGDTLTGKVTRLEAFGAFVELSSGVEGLIHVSEISWTHLRHPSEALEVGQTVSAKLLKIEEDTNGRLRISLSRKQVEGNPWDEMTKKFPVGTILDGKIEKKERFGFFIQIAPGITGLLPKSHMKETTPDNSLEKKEVGETIKVQISQISPAERRISLSLPLDPEADAWKGFSSAGGKGFGSLGAAFEAANTKKKK